MERRPRAQPKKTSEDTRSDILPVILLFVDINRLGLLMSILTSLIVWSFFCMMFGFSTGALYSWIGTLLFCGFIVIDTQMIIHKLGYDDYIIASIELYLDIINLFLFILRILGGGRSGRN